MKKQTLEECKKEKVFYTASGQPIPESAVVELDCNNYVAQWKGKMTINYWKKMKLI